MSTRPSSPAPPVPLAARLPFFYGWVVVGVAFVTMGIGVNTRTAFSLLYPAILGEFGWSRAETAATFTLGFVVSAGVSPVLGMMMDRFGPRRVVPFGALVVGTGLALATLTSQPWHLYGSLGVLVVGGTVIFSYIGHSMFLPLWFVRRRGFAIGIAFSGVGVGSIVLFPWVQAIIGGAGWRQACWALAALLVLVVAPLNALLQRQRPEELGLRPDGDGGRARGEGARSALSADAAESTPPPPRVEWTLRAALRSAPFWWIGLGYFCGLFAWYMVQVHQTKYLLDVGVDAEQAALALGAVGLAGVAGQIGLGWLSDHAGREWAWTFAGLGFAACYVLLLVLGTHPAPVMVWLMVAAQGGLGYGLASVYGAIPAEIFHGRRLATIFGVISLAASLGAGTGPWVAGAIQDATGSYAPAFVLALALSLLSIGCIWVAAPRKGPVR